ncbi:hypothetical protein GCM10009740_16950 [Terrabacter terrae]|uniref:PH domain-containing protein n=1 Tax=Terrabacter terrae TaxID=318434 RepID=A0ABP5FJA8_9MICO
MGLIVWFAVGYILAGTSNWPLGVACLVVVGGAVFGLFAWGPKRLELRDSVITVRTIRGLKSFDLRDATSISYSGPWSHSSGDMAIHLPGPRSISITARGPDLIAFMSAVVAAADGLGLPDKVLDPSLRELR